MAFVSGPDKSLLQPELAPGPGSLAGQVWDRVYVTTLFTYDWKETIRTIELCRQLVGGSSRRLFVGGIMASLMAEDITQETGISPVCGVLTSPAQIGLEGDVNIDLLPPDYSIVDPRLYAVNETYYAYCSRGCVNNCGFCGVPRVEPAYLGYIDIKPTIEQMREEFGDKPKLKLMDNNVLPSPHLERIVDDLLELGYARGENTEEEQPRRRIVDFNQGLDAAHVTDRTMELLSKLNVSPMRVAFDRVEDRDEYERAVRLARDYGFTEFSNYMLYNWEDTPRDLYDRLMVNIDLNQEWKEQSVTGMRTAAIYSYPMRFAPIDESLGKHANRTRDHVSPTPLDLDDYIGDASWNRLFIRSVEVMKGVAHGAISPTPGLARRTIGATYEQFIANLYMPEELLRNRNRYEKRVYEHEPDRRAGTGEVEEFREFIFDLVRDKSRFREFHNAVTQRSAAAIRAYYAATPDEETRRWLRFYMRKK